MITQARLRELLDYDPQIGIFRWKVTRSRVARAGDVAGGPSHKAGYIVIRIDQRTHLAHRLAFLWMTGTVPSTVDHINRDTSDNRWCNLRGCTRSQNNCNSKMQKLRGIGLRGVKRNPHSGRYYAMIGHNGRQHYLGTYDSPEAAHSAYLSAAQDMHGDFMGEVRRHTSTGGGDE